LASPRRSSSLGVRQNITYEIVTFDDAVSGVTGSDLLEVDQLDKDDPRVNDLSVGKRLILVKRVQALQQSSRLSYVILFLYHDSI